MKIESPLPGVLSMFNVEPGAQVTNGQIIVTVECMKMQYEVAATADGVVKFFHEVGDIVGQGEFLAEIS